MLSRLSYRVSTTLYTTKRLFSVADLNNTVIVTNNCYKRIAELKKKQNNDNLHLRVSVNGGGCSGFQYKFEMDDSEIEVEDLIFEKDNNKVIIDTSSFELIKGSTIDYVQEMMRSSFVVTNNPQSESACGCGSSFAIKNFSLNPAND